MHVEFTVPDHAKLIEILLEGFIKAAELLIRSGAAPWRPPLELKLQDDDVPSWQLPTETMEKLTGDCEDLVIWWAGGLRASGRDPRARARIKTTGPMQTHCLLVTGGRTVDVYEQHLAAQRQRAAEDPEFQMGGFGSFLHSIGHGISSAAHGVAHAAQAVGRGIEHGAEAVAHGAQYVAKDLPGAVLREAGSGLKSVAGGIGGFVKDIGAAGSGIVNSVGDVVAGGAQDALHQVGKLVGGIGHSVASGFGDDTKSYNGGGDDGAVADGGDAAAGDIPPAAGYPGGAPGAELGVPYDGDEDPWEGMGEADGVPDDGGGDDYYDDEGSE